MEPEAPPSHESSVDTESSTSQKHCSGSDSGVKKGNDIVIRKPGYAPIKAEFLLPDHKPVLNLEYVSKEVKQNLQMQNDSKKEDPDEELHLTKHGLSDSEAKDEPPNKKAKLKGRNKKRPRFEKIKAKDKICPAVKTNRECQFGENCKFSHDKEEFLSLKPPDLEGTCPTYSRFGYCESSIACRFAKSHLSENFENLKNEDLYNKMKSEKAVNILSQDIRQKLWKRKYDFQRSNTVVKQVEKNFRGWGNPSENKEVNEMKETLITSNDLKKECLNKNTENAGIVETKEICEMSNGPNKCPDSNVESNRNDGKKMTPVIEHLNMNQSGESKCLKDTDTSGTKSTTETLVKATNLESSGSLLNTESVRTVGQITDEEVFPLRSREKIMIDFRDKLYLAPLTTVGNLPFRRICKGYGADVTCGEMALVSELLKGKLSEWSLIKRHPCEDIFGVQICGQYPDMMTRGAQLLTESFDVDFIDINCGCPIDMIYKKGAGSALMGKATKLEQICRSMKGVMGDTPLTVKVRTGVFDNKNVAHNLIPKLREAGVSLVTVHGRSREQRYTKTANWDYIGQCASAGAPMPVFGNGDILSYEEANLHRKESGVSGLMIARGALIKPWIFTEIKEQRHWDISSGERMDMMREFTNFGLEHWGSDNQGVENTRRFLLEWLSFLHRYIPVGVLEVLPQKINERPPYFMGRNDLETLMASANCADWVKITEMLLGPVPANFQFLPKHKANAYQ